MNESLDAETRLPAQRAAHRGESSVGEHCGPSVAGKAGAGARTLHDAHADDAAIVPRENALTLPRAHSPHADAPVV